MVELVNQPREVAYTVAIVGGERLHVLLIDDRIFVPNLLGVSRRFFNLRFHRHAPKRGDTRYSANGRSAGSRRMCCSLPCQVELILRIKSCSRRSSASLSARSSFPSGGT